MAIAQSKYINIISGQGGTAPVGQRDLIGRIFSTNSLIPTNTILEFSGGITGALPSIAEYFGVTSAEYTFASKYFQVNKTGSAPQKLSFARLLPEAVGATLIGAPSASPLNVLQAITAGTLSLTINGTAKTVENINFSTAEAFADVANILTNALSAAGATVSYNAPLSRFVFTTAATGPENTLTFATGDVAVALGITSTSGILSNGANSQTTLETIIKTTELNNNFFSFYLLNAAITSDVAAQIAAWVDSQNVRYMWSMDITPEESATFQPAVESYSGVALNLNKFSDMPAFMPMSRIASINFTQPGSALSMNYQQFAGVNPSVLSTDDSNKYDALRINYYGATQQAGQQVAWYQPGLLQGSIPDMGVYANEAWMKDSFFANLLNLRLGLNTLPANTTGVALVMGVLMDTINTALINGSILPGKVLDASDKAYITQITGDEEAWKQVQTSGYRLTADLEKYTENGVTKYKASYLLIYSKGDSINYIDGRDIMI